MIKSTIFFVVLADLHPPFLYSPVVDILCGKKININGNDLLILINLIQFSFILKLMLGFIFCGAVYNIEV